MTIESTTNVARYLGDGTNTIFSYNFLIPTADDVVATYTDLLGDQTILTPSQYTITGLGNSSGGLITFLWLGSPMTLGTSLTIERVLPVVQETDLTNQDNFYPTVIESALDYLTMLIQQSNSEFVNSIRVPLTDPVPNLLPPVAARANLGMAFDSNGNPIAAAIPASGIISSVMQPVVDASTLPDARHLMGISDGAAIDLINVLDYGADPTGVVDCTTEINQLIVDAIAAGGRDIYFPAGTYKVSSIVCDLSAEGNPFPSTRMRFHGDGEYISVLQGTSTTAPSFWYKGNSGNGFGTGLVIEGMGFAGPSNGVGSVGVRMDKVAFFSMRDCQIGFQETGIIGNDILSGSFENVRIFSNIFGGDFNIVSASEPNALSFRSCVITANGTWGLRFDTGSCINFYGGSIESNGLNGGAQSGFSWGIKSINGGLLAGQGLNMFGTYFEGNNGVGDIWINQPDTIGGNLICGCTFLRGTTPKFTAYNIFIDGDTPVAIDLNGNSFRGQAPYVASSGTPYVHSTNSLAVVNGFGNVYFDTLETPPDLPYELSTNWVSYGPITVTPGTGAFTTVAATGWYKFIGDRICAFRIKVVVTTKNTAAASATLTLPIAANGNSPHALLAIDFTGGVANFAEIAPGFAVATWVPAGAAFTDGHTYVISGEYETA